MNESDKRFQRMLLALQDVCKDAGREVLVVEADGKNKRKRLTPAAAEKLSAFLGPGYVLYDAGEEGIAGLNEMSLPELLDEVATLAPESERLTAFDELRRRARAFFPEAYCRKASAGAVMEKVLDLLGEEDPSVVPSAIETIIEQRNRAWNNERESKLHVDTMTKLNDVVQSNAALILQVEELTEERDRLESAAEPQPSEDAERLADEMYKWAADRTDTDSVCKACAFADRVRRLGKREAPAEVTVCWTPAALEHDEGVISAPSVYVPGDERIINEAGSGRMVHTLPVHGAQPSDNSPPTHGPWCEANMCVCDSGHPCDTCENLERACAIDPNVAGPCPKYKDHEARLGEIINGAQPSAECDGCDDMDGAMDTIARLRRERDALEHDLNECLRVMHRQAEKIRIIRRQATILPHGRALVLDHIARTLEGARVGLIEEECKPEELREVVQVRPVGSALVAAETITLPHGVKLPGRVLDLREMPEDAKADLLREFNRSMGAPDEEWLCGHCGRLYNVADTLVDISDGPRPVCPTCNVELTPPVKPTGPQEGGTP